MPVKAWATGPVGTRGCSKCRCSGKGGFRQRIGSTVGGLFDGAGSRERADVIKPYAEWEVAAYLKMLDRAPEGRDYLCGRELSAADLPVFTVLGWERVLANGRRR